MPSSPPNAPYTTPNTASTHLKAAIDDLILSHIAEIGPSMLVRVEAVHSSGASLTGNVDVLPLVQQQDSLNRPYPHTTLHNVPYLRIQGGTSALIIDPKPGDIGFIVVSGRDHSNAIAARAPAPPASARQYCLNDCVYVGGFLNDAPNQYVQFTEGGIRIVTPSKVEIEAQGDVTVTASGKATIKAAEMDVRGPLNVQGDLKTTGDVTAGRISLQSHTHSGVQPGGGESGKSQ